ncbi:MAG: transcriptional regulator [Firmicutes bacterium]|nr:transcriptional regulator [Bacillota bacterium]
MQKKEALDFLIRLAGGIADTFGKSCETVVHEIDGESMEVRYIKNGSVTGRKIGDEKSLVGDKQFIKKIYSGKDLANFRAVTQDGKLVKSTTIHFKGEGYHFAFGINFDYTMLSMAGNTIAELLKTGPEYKKILEASQKINIDEIFADCVEKIGVPVTFMKKDDKHKLLKMLNSRYVFTVQGSVPKIAEKLGISRYTVYKHLRYIRDSGDSKK